MGVLGHSFPRVELRTLGILQFSHLSASSAEWPVSSTYSPRLAYGLGIGLSFPVSQKVSLETDILYKTKRSELTKFSDLDWNDTFYDLRCLAVPLLAQARFQISKIELRAILGAEGSWIFNSRIEDKKDDIILEPIPGLKSYDLQAVGGVGILYQRISLEFRYQYGLLNLSKERESGLSIRNHGFEFLIGFRL